MYHEIRSIIRHRGELTDVAIQCGISRGIPMIKMYGSISREYSRYRELLPYTFAQVGRKLPQRKIHINYSSDSSGIQTRDLDLPTALSIYSAINAYEQRDLYAIGELSMDGKISPSDETGALLYILDSRSDLRKASVYGANLIISAETLFPNVEYIQTPTLLHCIRNLEGDIDESNQRGQTVLKNSPNSAIVESSDLPHFLAIALGLNCVVIDEDNYATLPSATARSAHQNEGVYSLELKRLTKAIGRYLEPICYDGAMINGITGITHLQNLLELSKRTGSGCALYLNLTLTDIKDQKIQEQVIKLLSIRTGVIVSIPRCPCGCSKSCSCSTTDRLKYKTFVNGLYESVRIVLRNSDIGRITPPSCWFEGGKKRLMWKSGAEALYSNTENSNLNIISSEGVKKTANHKNIPPELILDTTDHKGQSTFLKYFSEADCLDEEMKATLRRVSRTSLENIELF